LHMKKLLIIGFFVYFAIFSYTRWSIEEEYCYVDGAWIC
jgi:hypothetical protein